MPVCRPLSDAEVERVRLSFHGRYQARDRALFTLGVRCGFRISELLSLRVRDVVQDGRLVDFLTIARGRMKGRRRSRTVALHPEAKQDLRTWLVDLTERTPLAPEAFVFRSRKGVNQAISRRRALRLLQARFRALGMSGPLGTHSMRKTFAMRMHARLGNDLHKTRQALGQKDLRSTIHYLPVDQEEIDRAVLSLEFGRRPRLDPEGNAWPGIRRGGSNGTTHHQAADEQT